MKKQWILKHEADGYSVKSGTVTIAKVKGSWGEIEATARLIAMAPVMLEALKDIVRLSRGALETDMDVESLCNTMRTRVEGVIAQVEGDN